MLAIPVSNFLNSLGVNTHVAQGNPVSQYVNPLNYLGVRNIRDGGTGYVPQLISLHQQTGVKIAYGPPQVANIPTYVATLQAIAGAGALLAATGANEPNNWPVTYNGATGGGGGSWLTVAQYQAALYAAIKANSVLSSYPVFSVSEVGAETDNVGLQFLTIPTGSGLSMVDGTVFADYADVHSYLQAPGASTTYGDNWAWQAFEPALPNNWDGMYGSFGSTWKGKFDGYNASQLATLPRVCTETGWNSLTAPVGPGGNLWTQGVLLTNAVLDAFARGFSYTFLYQIIDSQGGQGADGWGLFDANFNPKLAAVFLHNLTDILEDEGTSRPIGALDYAIIGATTTGHDMLLQKSDGTFELVVWGESAAQIKTPVLVAFSETQASVKIYDITVSYDPIAVYSNVSSVPLLISDHAMVVEIG